MLSFGFYVVWNEDEKVCVFKDGGWIKQMVEILTPRIIFPNLPGTLSCTTGAISLLAILKIVKKMPVWWWCLHYDLF